MRGTWHIMSPPSKKVGSRPPPNCTHGEVVADGYAHFFGRRNIICHGTHGKVDAEDADISEVFRIS